ncbi:MAG: phosphoribosyltransferase [Caulobacteraceae bacterium]
MDEAALLDAEEIARRITGLAARLAGAVDEETVIVPILLGGLWFAADLTRALARLGPNPRFDAVWLASYGDGRSSDGRCEVIATLQRPLAGLKALILDEVVESGVSLAKAVEIVRAAGAREVTTAVFARKPAPAARAIEPDHVAWEAPARFLFGYGMDLAGRRRAQPWIEAAP